MNNHSTEKFKIKNIIRIFPFLAIPYYFLNAFAGQCDAKHYHKVTMGQAYSDLYWIQEAWTGDDKPFEKARSTITSQLVTCLDPRVLIEKLKTEALQKPTNALAQFRWGFAAYTYASNQTVKEAVGDNILPQILVALASAQSPHTYNYDRLRFMILSRGIPPHQLKSMGERLLNKNSQDAQVKYGLASFLKYSNAVRDRQMALAYAQQLANQYPKEAKYYGLLAGIAYTTWFRSKSQTDANKAIAAYRHYLDIAAPDEVFRDNAQFYIRYIQQKQDNWNKGEELP